MSKVILVPTDFSECAAAAYSYAVSLAEKTKATIQLLHVLDIPSPYLSSATEEGTTGDAHYMMVFLKKIHLRMKKLKSNKIFKNIPVRESVEIGEVPVKILDAISKYKAEMVVMGTHGQGAHPEYVGANAEKVVRDASVPVLTVKEQIRTPKIKTILLATDLSDEAGQLLPVISNMAVMYNARLVVAKIITMARFKSTTETDKELALFRKKFDKYEFSTEVYYAYDKPEGIRSAAAQAGADLIAMGTHGRHGLAHFFKGSIAEDVVERASLPVLTINFQNKLKALVANGQKQRNENIESLSYHIPAI